MLHPSRSQQQTPLQLHPSSTAINHCTQLSNQLLLLGAWCLSISFHISVAVILEIHQRKSRRLILILPCRPSLQNRFVTENYWRIKVYSHLRGAILTYGLAPVHSMGANALLSFLTQKAFVCNLQTTKAFLYTDASGEICLNSGHKAHWDKAQRHQLVKINNSFCRY